MTKLINLYSQTRNATYLISSKPHGPWDQAVLVTPRHSVRNIWNEHALAKHCIKTGNQRYLVPAEDISRDGVEGLTMEAKLAIAALDDQKTGKLPGNCLCGNWNEGHGPIKPSNRGKRNTRN